jgi:hypothetical protein
LISTVFVVSTRRQVFGRSGPGHNLNDSRVATMKIGPGTRQILSWNQHFRDLIVGTVAVFQSQRVPPPISTFVPQESRYLIGRRSDRPLGHYQPTLQVWPRRKFVDSGMKRAEYGVILVMFSHPTGKFEVPLGYHKVLLGSTDPKSPF